MDIAVFDHQTVLQILPDRDPESHKGNFGRVLLLCGSVGYTGAAALSAMGALRSGAGLVYVGVPEDIYLIEAIKLTEAMVFPIPSYKGMFSTDAAEKISDLLNKMDAVLIGPGIGQSEGCTHFLSYVLKEFQGPVVVDADGINLIAAHKDILRGRKYPTVLTPHPGEYIRIAGFITENRAEDACALAKDLGCIVLLKGHETYISDGKKCICTKTGNPGMATGGSGDVLAGIIVSLIGQGIPCLEAAACGAWLAGAAGDLCEKQIGQYGMLPTDVLEVLPRLMK